MKDLQISSEITRIEQVTDRLLERRILEYNFSLSAIGVNLLQNTAITTSTMLSLFLVLSLIFQYETNEALKISGIVGSIIFAFYTIFMFSKDEVGLVKLIYMIGQLSNWKKIIHLNNVIINQQEQLEQMKAITSTTVLQELQANVKSYYNGNGFNPNSKAFPYLMKRKLASLDNNGIVVLHAATMADLLNKLKSSK